jgi:glutamyl-Q tRNA(Asp) synthetase
MSYIGRFAPSPTGPLHAGSLLAALASWLDARAHGGQWLVRVEDVDRVRSVPGLDRIILRQLSDCGLHPDRPPVWQSKRSVLYQQALDRLRAQSLAYPCNCSRHDIEAALSQPGRSRTRHAERVYPGSCRAGLSHRTGKAGNARETGLAWRLRTDAVPAVHWTDRRLGEQRQDVASEVGDFVLKRADECFSYQLAVVVDDAAQSITDVVRGADLCDNTARQILLQRRLGLPTLRYLHTPLVLGANLEKLSKQNGAQAIDTQAPLDALNHAAAELGLPPHRGPLTDAFNLWIQAWKQAWVRVYNPAP